MLYNEFAKKIIDKIFKDLNQWTEQHREASYELKSHREEMEKTIEHILEYQLSVRTDINIIRDYILSLPIPTFGETEPQNNALNSLESLESQLRNMWLQLQE